MKTKNYSFAGLEVQISMEDDLMYTNDGKLSEFVVSKVKDPHFFYFKRVENLSEPQGELVTIQPNFRVYDYGESQIRYLGPTSLGLSNAYARVTHIGKQHTVELKCDAFKDRIWSHSVLDTLAAEHLLAQNHGLILHCSYIEYDEKAILFTAPSETGKSTQADLWKRYRGANIINGDRAAVCMIDNKLYAEGIPFSGSSAYCYNKKTPLTAIVYLGQAPTTSIRRIQGHEAFLRIWEGISVNTWDKRDVDNISALLKNIVETIPVYYLQCTPDESAIFALERMLEGELR